jgi:hypothetical protein
MVVFLFLSLVFHGFLPGIYSFCQFSMGFVFFFLVFPKKIDLQNYKFERKKSKSNFVLIQNLFSFKFCSNSNFFIQKNQNRILFKFRNLYIF